VQALLAVEVVNLSRLMVALGVTRRRSLRRRVAASRGVTEADAHRTMGQCGLCPDSYEPNLGKVHSGNLAGI